LGRTISLSDCGQHIVDYQFGRRAAEKAKGVEQTLVQGHLLLRMGKGHIQLFPDVPDRTALGRRS
jgi:hypothetical protein